MGHTAPSDPGFLTGLCLLVSSFSVATHKTQFRKSEKKKTETLSISFFIIIILISWKFTVSGHRFPHSTPTGSTHQHSGYPSAQSQTALSRAGCPQCPPAQPPQSCPTRKVERGKSSSSVPEVTTVSIQELKRFFPAEKPIILHISRASKALCGKDWIIVG